MPLSRTSFGLAALVALGAGGPAAAATAPLAVEIRHAAARVVVIPEARQDIRVEVLHAHPGLPLVVRQAKGRTVVDGNLRGRVGMCVNRGRPVVHVRGVGDVPYEELPQLAVRVPADVRIEADGAVFGAVGRSASLELSNAGCGDWTVANVRGQLKINQAGSGDTRAGAAGVLVARVAGSGDVSTGPIAGGATVDLAGSGDVTAASIDGPLRASLAGSGDVRVASGRAPEVVARIAGSGDVRFGGEAASVDARIAGSGDVVVRRLNGPAHKTVLGSGEVIVGD